MTAPSPEQNSNNWGWLSSFHDKGIQCENRFFGSIGPSITEDKRCRSNVFFISSELYSRCSARYL